MRTSLLAEDAASVDDLGSSHTSSSSSTSLGGLLSKSSAPISRRTLTLLVAVNALLLLVVVVLGVAYAGSSIRVLEKCKMQSTMLAGPQLSRWRRWWYHLVAILTSGSVAAPVAEGVGTAAG